MHIYFVGIGGTAIGPLAMIAHQAGYSVSGSDKRDSQYIQYLKKHGINDIVISNNDTEIEETHQKNPIDWLVYTSAVVFENPEHPQLEWAKKNEIKVTKRDELLNQIIADQKLKLIAIAGTHGKTTTTAMMVWLMQKVNIPVSYSVGAKISFGDMGNFDPQAEYFIYECDEFDRNFLSFHPYLSLITGIDYDHHEIYKNIDEYRSAFKDFISQSQQNIVWQSDIDRVNIKLESTDNVLADDDKMLNSLSIAGHVNRRNAWQVMNAVHKITNIPLAELRPHAESFPGLSRRFEKLADNLYTDYAHTIPKISGCLQQALELSNNVVVVYEPLTNRRQHFVKHQYADLFQGVKQLYWVPSYLAREDPDQTILSPEDLISGLNNKEIASPELLNDSLKAKIESHIKEGDLVICISGGGGGSLDEWLRAEFQA